MIKNTLKKALKKGLVYGVTLASAASLFFSSSKKAYAQDMSLKQEVKETLKKTASVTSNMIPAYYLSLIVHEKGHADFMTNLGVNNHIEIKGIGGITRLDENPMLNQKDYEKFCVEGINKSKEFKRYLEYQINSGSVKKEDLKFIAASALLADLDLFTYTIKDTLVRNNLYPDTKKSDIDSYLLYSNKPFEEILTKAAVDFAFNLPENLKLAGYILGKDVKPKPYNVSLDCGLDRCGIYLTMDPNFLENKIEDIYYKNKKN